MPIEIRNRYTGDVLLTVKGETLRATDLSGANLSRANLSRANLSGANLAWAKLSGANLSGADLSGADGAALALAQTLIVPQNGDVVGWKKLAGGVLCKLLIPDGAKRFNAAGRKCRAERATVLELEGAEVGYSGHDITFEYRVGRIVTPREPFDEDRWNECASGIHFFITREEAEAY